MEEYEILNENNVLIGETIFKAHCKSLLDAIYDYAWTQTNEESYEEEWQFIEDEAWTLNQIEVEELKLRKELENKYELNLKEFDWDFYYYMNYTVGIASLAKLENLSKRKENIEKIISGIEFMLDWPEYDPYYEISSEMELYEEIFGEPLIISQIVVNDLKDEILEIENKIIDLNIPKGFLRIQKESEER